MHMTPLQAIHITLHIQKMTGSAYVICTPIMCNQFLLSGHTSYIEEMQTVWDKKSTSWVTAINICTIWPLILADRKCTTSRISSLCLTANEIYTLLGFSTGQNGNSVLTFQYNLSHLQGSSSLLLHTRRTFLISKAIIKESCSTKQYATCEASDVTASAMPVPSS